MTSPALTLLHTSDWHLGHELNGHNREAEHDAFLDWLMEELERQAVDVLLVTGDVYDVANPPTTAMRRLFGFIQSATSLMPHLQVIILGGNHDSAARIDLPSALLGDGQVTFIGALPRRDGAPDFDRLMVPLKDRNGTAAAWLAAIPFCRPADLGAMDLPQLYKAIAEAGAEKSGQLPLVLTGHLHVAGAAVSEMSERRIVIGGEEAQSAALFDASAAYVALGHLHCPQDISGATRIRYAGSPFPLSSTERNYKHSVSLVRLGGEVPCAVEEVPIPRPAAFLSIGPAPLDEAVRQIEALELDEALPQGAWPFIEIAVSVSGPEPHLQQRILTALEGRPARLVRIMRVMADRESGAAETPVLQDLDELQPEQVFAALYAQQFNGEPQDDLARAFAQLLVETHSEGGNA